MNDFEKLVLEMRDNQKKYFKTRNMAVLQESKRLEKAVDDHLKNITNPKMEL